MTAEATLDRNIQTALEAIQLATQGMTEEELLRHPEGKWSSAEILEHLSLAFTGTIRGMQRAMAGSLAGNPIKFKDRIAQGMVVGLGYFPSGRKSPKMVEPTGKIGGKEIVVKIQEDLRQMDAMLAECKAKYGGSAYVMDHPVLGPLTLDQWPKFHRVHTVHHMKQIKKIRSAQPA